MSDSDKPKSEPAGHLEKSDPEKPGFVPEALDRTVIAIPLLKDLKKEDEGEATPALHDVIIDLNLEFPGDSNHPAGRIGAREWVKAKARELIDARVEGEPADQWVKSSKEQFDVSTPQYVFASLRGRVIRGLVTSDAAEHDADGSDFRRRAIYHIWPDFDIHPLTNKSVSTVKADAARASFAAFGDEIVWAVMDSGINGDHPHFKENDNLSLKTFHADFTGKDAPLQDDFGHGTHVAGIIAGQMPKDGSMTAVVRSRDENGNVTSQNIKMNAISGMAPKTKLVSLRVLDENGRGGTSNLIAAIAKIQDINDHGRRILIHGVNISVGNSFDPEWFACGQSPLCVEVNQLVKSGVVVVVAAGNSGYGKETTQFTGIISAGLGMTINDPGNADLAITVGSTHRDMPHIYGVSYFSSKGPTGDGRAKPDIVAPGEKIISCAAGSKKSQAVSQTGQAAPDDCNYLEDSGTSMAAPHVSGVIAAFLSIRREFIGQPEKVKEIFLSTATDLKRERYFQGYGLVDLMRAIQSV
ncbi:MAG TPA: S8 family peptidase [Pyrinomonadaceae bacterium]|nr:S8 family peptidase [Pyrinomonadaceae bacterium]